MMRGDEEPPPFLCTLNPLPPRPLPPLHLRSTLSWLSYGALKGDWTVIVVNAVGTALQTLYVLMYLHFCSRKVDARPPCTPFCVAHLALPCWQLQPAS